MQTILTQIAEHRALTREDAARAMSLMLKGEASPEQIAAFLLGLRSRGETLEELIGLTESMRKFAVSVSAPAHAVDIVGTGGDRSGSFNISTTTALVCAGAGAVVAKHGNRSVSSKCGSADVLELLGVKTELGKEGVEYCLNEAGIGFLFAPYFHPALKHVMPVRKHLGVRTCFNILGPMCNPAATSRQLIGAFSREVAEAMAHIFSTLGSERTICVHADDGLDEVSLSGSTVVFSRLTADGPIDVQEFHPKALGINPAPLSAIMGGDAARNAELLKRVLKGKGGPRRDIVLLNASFALLAAGEVDRLEDGIQRAAEAIDSGNARLSLERLVDVSQQAPELNA
ncbi:MAG: anthranilate phosphoribosyltransferase [Bacteroidetes Order II. Incertae sedis bacterium]|nr:anthranilate phosphoribosyltransferase [Bacteroidetes Order II. bacterium]